VYSKGVAARRTVPNGIDSKAQQAPDYAPNWFRESGDIAGGAMYGAGPMEEKAGKEFRHAALKAHKLAHKALAVEGKGRQMHRMPDGSRMEGPPCDVAKAHSKKMAGGVAPKAKRALSERQIARNALVKQVMAEKGLKMIDASRYIKEHDLF